MGGVNFGGVNITNLKYADDAVLIAESIKPLQEMMESLNRTCEEYGRPLSINLKKTMVMILGNSENKQCEILLNNTILEQVKHYKYLSSWITEDLSALQ